MVERIFITGCVILSAEAFKLAGVIVTVFHLLLMVSMHLIGVTHPVKCKKVRMDITREMAPFRGLSLALWGLGGIKNPMAKPMAKNHGKSVGQTDKICWMDGQIQTP